VRTGHLTAYSPRTGAFPEPPPDSLYSAGVFDVHGGIRIRLLFIRAQHLLDRLVPL